MNLNYTVVYSVRRKKLSITVERDRSIVVRAPEGTTPEKIEAIIESRKQWIYQKINHPQKYRPQLPPGKELVNGESILYLGRSYRIELYEGFGSIQLGERLLVPKQVAKKRDIFREWYIEQAKKIILPRVPEFAQTLGVSFNQAKINSSKYRWGSCTPKNNLNFNWRLIKAPMFVINYVIIHELTHLLEPNHTPRFWNIIRAQIATMEKAKTWLKENGQLLEMDI